MRSWDEKLERLSTEQTAVGSGGDVGYVDLTGVPTDSAAFVAEKTALTNADDALGDRITDLEGLVVGNLEDFADLSLSNNSLIYKTGSGIEELTLGTNLSITAGVLNASSGGGGGASSLDDLSDVVVEDPITGNVIWFDGDNFINVPMALDLIEDIDLTGIAEGDVMRWNNSESQFEAGQALGGVENLVVLRGSVSSAGSISAGSGFSITNMGTGDYRINFNTTYSAVPTVVATIRNALAGSFRRIRVASESTTSCRVLIDDGSSAVAEGFGFVVLGV